MCSDWTLSLHEYVKADRAIGPLTMVAGWEMPYSIGRFFKDHRDVSCCAVYLYVQHQGKISNLGIFPGIGWEAFRQQVPNTKVELPHNFLLTIFILYTNNKREIWGRNLLKKLERKGLVNLWSHSVSNMEIKF